MHPVLADRKRLALYLLTWCLLGFLLALVVMEPGRVAFVDAIVLTMPPTIVYAFICLAAWYPTRAMPLHRARAGGVFLAHGLAAIFFSGLWLLMFQGWGRVRGAAEAIATRVAVLVVTGLLLYVLAVAFHYVLVAIEHAREIQQREMNVRLLAREAELKALKSQLDPHFLFNSLNSISALCGSNPTSARTLTTLLAEYLRKSLRIGRAESITLSEELELASSYLAIERIRFGPRLEFEQNVDERLRDFRVPPLLLQPLVENAVTHGVGHLLEGGVVRMSAERDGDRVRIAVENRCDPDRPASRGEGIGLSNTRKRIDAFYGPSARMETVSEPAHFRIDLVLPA
jgi:two-component system, LytTR family, sensor histidine kinase AlgZ